MAIDNRRDPSSWMRAIYNYTMGVLWLAVGIFFLFHRKWGYDLNLNTKSEILLTNIFGASAVLYGLFRIYRGFKTK